MGVAVLLNKGTNIFIGTVSFLTENVSIILQLATSMDYSIFLLDAFMNYRKQGMNEEDAIINAVQEAINSILRQQPDDSCRLLGPCDDEVLHRI